MIERRRVFLRAACAVTACMSVGLPGPSAQADVLTPQIEAVRTQYNALADRAAAGDEAAFTALAEAAESDDGLVAAAALVNIGWMLDTGNGIERDPHIAMEYYRGAIGAGYPFAEYNYAKSLENGYGEEGTGTGSGIGSGEAWRYYARAGLDGSAGGALKAAAILGKDYPGIPANHPLSAAYYDLTLALEPSAAQRSEAEAGLAAQKALLPADSEIPDIGGQIRRTAQQLRDGTYGQQAQRPAPLSTPAPSAQALTVPPAERAPAIRADIVSRARACIPERTDLDNWRDESSEAYGKLRSWATRIDRKQKDLNVEYNMNVRNPDFDFNDFRRRESAVNAELSDYNSQKRRIDSETDRYHDQYADHKERCSFSMSGAELAEVCSGTNAATAWCKRYD